MTDIVYLTKYTLLLQAPSKGSALLSSQTDSPSQLISLCGVLVRAENVARLAFDGVDELAHLREEWVVVGKAVALDVVVSRPAHSEHWRVVRVNQTHVVSVCPELQLAIVLCSLECDGVREGSYGSRLVLPYCGCDTGDTLVLWDYRLVHWDLGQLSWFLIPFDRASSDRRDVDIAAKVTRQVTEVGTLLNDWSHVLELVPPRRLGDRLVCCRVTCVCRHDRQVVFVDDLLHLLNAAEVAQHVADRDDIAVLDEAFGHLLDLIYGGGRDGLLDKVADCGEVLHEVELEVASLAQAATEGWRSADNNGAEVSHSPKHTHTEARLLQTL